MGQNVRTNLKITDKLIGMFSQTPITKKNLKLYTNYQTKENEVLYVKYDEDGKTILKRSYLPELNEVDISLMRNDFIIERGDTMYLTVDNFVKLSQKSKT
jgi:hypothetical protein